MSITSLVFVIFVAIAGVVYYLVPKKMQWIVLLVASLFFYAISSTILTLFMIASTLLIYLGALKIQGLNDEFKAKKADLEKSERKQLKASIKKKQKAVLTAIVVLNIAILAVLKYGNFFGGMANSVIGLFTHKDVIPTFNFILPLGISYYTLMAISYIVDVYRGTVKAEKNPCRVLLFVSYFPHIIEGPFDRYGALDKQFKEPHYLDYDVVKNGALLMLFGLFKKLVIADRIGLIASGVFEKPDEFSGTAIIIAIISYTIQLYCDFSGCIDIVAGVSEMFDIKLAENFRQPFFARSINEFWRRWHITLGLWLKEYVFYPVSLSGSFKKVNTFAKKHIKNEYFVQMIPAAYALFFVWFCNGIWHGSSGKYIFYGLYYYLLMMLGEFTKPITDKLCTKLKINRETKAYHLFQMVRTFIIVNTGMLIFRSATISESTNLFLQMFKSVSFTDLLQREAIPHISFRDYPVILVGIAVVFIIGLLKEKGHNIREELAQKPLILRWVLYLLLIFSILIVGMYGNNAGGEAAAIYAQF